MFHLMTDISCNKTTHKYNVLSIAFALSVNNNNRTTGPTGVNVKGNIHGLIISTVLRQFNISVLHL